MADEKNKAAGAEGTTALTPEQEIKKLKADLVAATAEIGKKDKDLEKVKAESEKKDVALDTSKKLIQEQAEALATKEVQAASKNPVVMVDKTHYAFLGKGNIIINGKATPAKEVMESKEALAYLLKIGSGLMKKITPKKGGK